ncbi:GP210 protein [Hibiscus syriacus]|uniref:GP210 protein n=1 Tax=Hibiscus syriacus TaxID=106335 RepID=A0A6A2ZQS2_HIBSY|nr:GP210 protein [Hibiscus syriacus]
MLSPKGLGTAVVTVYDIGLTPNLVASVVVQVSDIDWIEIMSGEEISLMVEGSSKSIGLMAGVDDGSTFDIPQFSYMNIHVHIEDVIVELVDKDDFSSPNGGYVSMQNFKIRAKHLGITTLYVSARRHFGHEILSQAIKVEVYAPPTIHPPNIFLVPGASYLLTIKGGPTLGAFVEYTSTDDAIATVDKTSGRLTATSPGNTTLIAKVYGNGDDVICQAYSSVKVGVPSSAILNVQSEQLAVGHLFSFYGLCKDYEWTIENEEVESAVVSNCVLTFGVPLVGSEAVQRFSYVDKEKLSFINVLYGRAPGRTNIAVSFSCDFISSGSHLEARTYNASLSLLVVSDLPLALGAPITWVIPPHYTTSSILPSSTESRGQKDSQSRKGSIIYSLLRNFEEGTEVSQRAVSIDGDKIKTEESNNLACILAKDRITGRAEIASCVRVAEVEQIRITIKEFPVHAIDLAVGAEIELSTSYYDALGNPFYEASNVILHHAETNSPDVISVNSTHDTNIIHLKAMRHGRALLKVSIDNRPQKSDYMLISVGAHVQPQNPILHQGSSINFSVVGCDDQASGHWYSVNESVIVFHTRSGQAEAVGEGSTQVYFKSSDVKLQTTVTVLPGSTLVVDAPKEMLTNVPFPSQGFSFSVKFSDANDKINTIGSSEGAPYDCRVDPPFVGYAKPWVDIDTGNSFCLFFPYSPEHLVRTAPKLKNMKPYIYVSINASLKEHSHVSGSASALFVGGFSIVQMGKDTTQLNLTPDSNKTIITILGNTDVEIHWHGQGLLTINPIHEEGFGAARSIQYEVKASSAKQFTDKIIVTLPSTGQRVELDVNYEPDEKPEPKAPINISFWAKVLGSLALTIITVIVGFICLSDRPLGSSQPPSTPQPTSVISAPVTPDRRSPLRFDEQSPRTPQPFVDYVRRTIDETPYYRREGRRRFNPQNTY